MTDATRFYRNGELVEYTGDSSVEYGQTWYTLRVVGDSHRIGAELVTSKAPSAKQYAEMVDHA